MQELGKGRSKASVVKRKGKDLSASGGECMPIGKGKGKVYIPQRGRKSIGPK